MCEIAVVDPETCDITTIHQLAYKFEEEQGDGLGVLAVKPQDDGTFEYDVYKSINPHWQTMFSFLNRNLDDTWRFIIHGRASTSGKVNREAAHPIRTDCDLCEFEYVVHNGSVRNHQNIRASLTSHGHWFNTKVDTEVLAHKVRRLPETIEDHDKDTYSFRGNLNYLLFSEDGIVIRVGSKYHLTDDFTMTCSLSAFDDHEEHGFERGNDNEWMLITPNETEPLAPEIETKERQTYRRSGKGSAYRSNTARSGSGNQQNITWAGGTPNLGTYTKEYEDHAEYEMISAIKVAPGVMEVIDTVDESSEFVYRDANPRLYYWYAPDEVPDNIGQLEELAEQNPYKPGQTNLEDFAEGNEEGAPEKEVAEEPTAQAIAEAEDEVTMEEAAEIADEVHEKLRETDETIRETIGG